MGEPTKENPEGVWTVYCTNVFCRGRMISHLTYVGARACLDIEGLGDALSEQFVHEGVIVNLGSLWEWANESKAYLDEAGEEAFRAACEGAGYPPAQCMTLVSGCMRAKTSPWDTWLMALGIPGVAKELSKGLAAYLALQPEDLPNLGRRLLELAPKQVDGLGVEKIKDIFKWAQDPRALQCLQQLHDAGVRPASTVTLNEGPTPLAGFVICITGEFGPERTSLQKQLESLGAVTKTGVSKKVNLLLTGDGAGRTKLTKAAELGIRTEGKDWLIKTFEAAGLTLGSSGMDDIPDAFDGL